MGNQSDQRWIRAASVLQKVRAAWQASLPRSLGRLSANGTVVLRFGRAEPGGVRVAACRA